MPLIIFYRASCPIVYEAIQVHEVMIEGKFLKGYKFW